MDKIHGVDFRVFDNHLAEPNQLQPFQAVGNLLGSGGGTVISQKLIEWHDIIDIDARAVLFP